MFCSDGKGGRNNPGVNRPRHGQRCKGASQRNDLGMDEVGNHVGRFWGFSRQEFPTERTYYRTACDLNNGDLKAEQTQDKRTKQH